MRRGGGSDAFVESLLQTLLCESRALDELDSADLLGECSALFVRDGRLAVLREALEHFFIVAKIDLCGGENDGSVGAMVMKFRIPLGANVFEGSGVDSGVEHQENVGLGVGQRAQAVVVVLARGIPETQVEWLAIDHNVCAVVVEHGGEVILGEGVAGVRDEHRRFAHGSVADDDALDGSEDGHGECDAM